LKPRTLMSSIMRARSGLTGRCEGSEVIRGSFLAARRLDKLPGSSFYYCRYLQIFVRFCERIRQMSPVNYFGLRPRITVGTHISM
jgi:hypothetical protein